MSKSPTKRVKTSTEIKLMLEAYKTESAIRIQAIKAANNTRLSRLIQQCEAPKNNLPPALRNLKVALFFNLYNGDINKAIVAESSKEFIDTKNPGPAEQNIKKRNSREEQGKQGKRARTAASPTKKASKKAETGKGERPPAGDFTFSASDVAGTRDGIMTQEMFAARLLEVQKEMDERMKRFQEDCLQILTSKLGKDVLEELRHDFATLKP